MLINLPIPVDCLLDRQPQKQKTNVSSSSPKNETKLAKFSLSSTGKIKVN